MKNFLFCLLVLLALFSATEAIRVQAKSASKVRAASTARAHARSQQSGPHCEFQRYCAVEDIPGWGEEEICRDILICIT